MESNLILLSPVANKVLRSKLVRAVNLPPCKDKQPQVRPEKAIVEKVLEVLMKESPVKERDQF